MKEYRFKINGNEYNVAVNSVSGNTADVTVNGTSYKVEREKAEAGAAKAAPVSATAKSAQPAVVPEPAVTGGKTVNSPLPGVIVEVKVNVGEAVKAGQVVAILEAMKMENEIQAECDGTVAAVNVAQGDSVLEGAAIVTIA